MTETRLFTLDGALRNDPAVRRWFAVPSNGLRLVAREWFEQMRSCGPDVLELLHDGHPTACVGNLAFGYVNAFRDHVNIGFFFGSVLEDPAGLLEGTGRFMRHVKVGPDLPRPEQALRELIAAAYADVKSSRLRACAAQARPDNPGRHRHATQLDSGVRPHRTGDHD